MRTLESIKTPFAKNMKSIYSYEKRKDYIRKATVQLNGTRGFNPRVARYRSNRGLAFNKSNLITNLTIQLIPLVALIILLAVRFIMG